MDGLLFNKSHEWIKVESDTATVGISDYAQSQLGDIVFVELPQAGAFFEKSSQFGIIESTKTASEVFIPISGEIIKVNSDLNNNPQLINQDPYKKGWMIKVKIKDRNEIDLLMSDEAYKTFIEKETH